MKVVTTSLQVTENDRAAMTHFHALWEEFNKSLNGNIANHPIAPHDRILLFGIYAQGWGRTAY